nr:hypothetical protein [Tanacetum cinerariifolium]
MDDPNITMEEYISREEEKDRRRGKVFNWETAKYGKIWYDEDVHNTRSVETEFPAIVFNDKLTSNKTPFCEPTVSSLNDEIDFRISFYDSDDEDYMEIYDKKSFSYKIISVNDLKTDSKNDNDKINVPLLTSPEPTIADTTYPNPMDTTYSSSRRYPVFIFSTVYTTYLLNEYNVFYTGINTTYPRDFVKERLTIIGGEFRNLEVLEY